MSSTVISSHNIASGVSVDEHSFTWTIQNFSVLQTAPELIKSQTFDFTAGESLGGLPFTWTIYLKMSEPNGVGLFVKLKEKPKTANNEIYSSLSFVIKNNEGTHNYSCGEGQVRSWPDYGFGKMLYESELRDVPLKEGNLEVQITFKMYSPSAPTPMFKPVQTMLEEFLVKATAKAWRELAESLQSSADVNANETQVLMSNDGKEFSVKKLILAARSPVFEAMLRTDMTKGNGAPIELPDTSSKTLNILLNFIRTGDLQQDWDQGEVLVELTNAAAKFQLLDLLEFLDSVLGKVCTLQNAGPLMILAHNMYLMKAEAELMSFLREKGVSSPDNLLQILQGLPQWIIRHGDGGGASQMYSFVCPSLSSQNPEEINPV